jgi:hypothetical protein
VRKHHEDFAAEMLFVEAEGCFAVAAVIEIRVKFHDVGSLLAEKSKSDYLHIASYLCRLAEPEKRKRRGRREWGGKTGGSKRDPSLRPG